jgi:hypothetical protein
MRRAWAYALVVLAGCGYAPLVTAAPFGAQRIAVLPFLEDEAVGIAPDLLQELSTLLAQGGTTLTVDRQHADAVLTGTVTESRAAPAPGFASVVSSYELSIVVKAKLVRADDTLFTTTVTATDDYLTSRDGTTSAPLLTEANRREAVRRLARTLARQLYDQLAMAGRGA